VNLDTFYISEILLDNVLYPGITCNGIIGVCHSPSLLVIEKEEAIEGSLLPFLA
jgi:hypothetical protein